jgi:excisionase family DNA binding protein
VQQQPDPLQRHLTIFNISELADYLRVSRSLIHKLNRTGKGPAFLRFGRSIRYDKAEVDSWKISCVWQSLRRRKGFNADRSAPASNREPSHAR